MSSATVTLTNNGFFARAMSGTLPSSLGAATFLQEISIHENYLTGLYATSLPSCCDTYAVMLISDLFCVFVLHGFYQAPCRLRGVHFLIFKI